MPFKQIKYILINNKKSFLLTIFFTIAFIININSQNLYAGIEIGSKGIKISVLDVKNIKKGNYEVIAFWTDNVGIAKGISIDGKLAIEDIANATNVVYLNHQTLLKKYNVPNNRIFVVASSGVGMAKNTQDLIFSIKEKTDKDLVIISSQLESKLLYRGCIPPNSYESSLVLDIGGGNTKGGYANLINDNMIFFPLNLDLGTVTLTEKINKIIPDNDLDKFLDESFKSQIALSKEVNKMYAQREHSKNKKNIYMSGGAVWAFYTLYKGNVAENFNPFTLTELKEYNAIVQNNFAKFKYMAETNPEIARVLKTYSQKHLISANNILISSVENLGNLESKKLFFAKNGQIAWLVSYIADASKGVAVVY